MAATKQIRIVTSARETIRSVAQVSLIGIRAPLVMNPLTIRHHSLIERSFKPFFPFPNTPMRTEDHRLEQRNERSAPREQNDWLPALLAPHPPIDEEPNLFHRTLSLPAL